MPAPSVAVKMWKSPQFSASLTTGNTLGASYLPHYPRGNLTGSTSPPPAVSSLVAAVFSVLEAMEASPQDLALCATGSVLHLFPKPFAVSPPQVLWVVHK